MDTATAHVQVQVSASPDQVWQALTEPEQIKAYFFGAEVDTTWAPGSPITWHGEYDGQADPHGEDRMCRPAVVRTDPRPASHPRAGEDQVLPLHRSVGAAGTLGEVGQGVVERGHPRGVVGDVPVDGDRRPVVRREVGA